MALDASRRGRWARATSCVGAAYCVSTTIKLAVGRRRPAVEDLPHLMATPTGLSFPVVARDVELRRRPRVRPAAARAGALPRGGRDGRVAALPRRALPVRRRGGRGAGDGPREPRAMKVGIVGMPNAGKSSLFNALTRAGAEAANYPFTTIEPNVAVVPVRDERLERGRADRRRVEHRPRHDRLPRHRRARRGRAQGRGPRQPVPREHPRDRRAAARRALPRRRQRDPPRGRGRPSAGHGDDRDRAGLRRPRAGRAAPCARRARGARRRQGRDRGGGLALRRDRRAPARGARAHRAGARRGAQRAAQPLAADRQAGALRRQRRRRRRRGPVGRRRPRGRGRRRGGRRLLAHRGRAVRARRRGGRGDAGGARRRRDRAATASCAARSGCST